MKWFSFIYHLLLVCTLLVIFAMIISAILAGHVGVVIALVVLFIFIATMH